ncbi:MAG TPA: enolase C-terminal domain-like protein [Acidobacteriaceae bacterium]|jgi:L-alanine-DL-glutamate epimerase-like enolase superfamily enzyme
MFAEATIRSGIARAYTIPTESPEADGTIAWDSTTLVVVEIRTGTETGIGYTYAHPTAAIVARELVEKHCLNQSAFDINALFTAMRTSQRNYGTEGIGATALSAVDIALWDLKAKLLGQSLAGLLGPIRTTVPVYGSGGFTTYGDAQLQEQLRGWIAQGIPRVKMKIGSHPEQDLRRIAVARKAIGDGAELFIDANGAYSRKQALYFSELAHAEHNVTWFEEPVSSDDLPGLHLLRNRAPAGMDIAAGEYGWSAMYLRKMIEAEAVDVMQADATRCGGITGFMDAASIADAHPIPLSAHCGPTIHMHLGCAARPLRHVEYFFDHVRIESMLFDGFRAAQSDGCMHPDFTRPGLGIEFKQKDAEKFAEKI